MGPGVTEPCMFPGMPGASHPSAGLGVDETRNGAEGQRTVRQFTTPATTGFPTHWMFENGRARMRGDYQVRR